MLRMRVCALQGDFSAGTQDSGCLFVRALSSCREKAPTPPRATLQPGHGAQGMSLCTPRAFFSRDTKLRMCVCVCQGDSSGGAQGSGCEFVRPRLKMCVRVPQGYSSGGAQGSTATFQPGHGAQEASRSKTGWLGGRMLDIHRAPGAKLNGSEAA